MSAVRLAIGEAGHVGRVRAVNQDASVVTEGLAAVADGMGGHAAGEIASQEALAVLAERFSGGSTEELVASVEAANAAVLERSRSDPELAGMGTTLTALGLVERNGNPMLALVNIGDSRTYRLRSDGLEQLTLDHSLVETMVRAGNLSPEEARVHPQRNILTRALGIDDEPLVDSWELAPEPGDRYLLCSDGLFNELDDARIASVLRRLADPEEAADELVRLAVAAGGRDNVTVVVVDVVEVVDDDSGAGVAGDAAEPDLDEPAPEVEPAAAAPAPKAAPRRVTWRTVLFLAAFLGVVAAASATVWWYARGTYYVGLDGDQVVIFQGRPGNVLWLEPTLAEQTALTLDDVPQKYVADLERGKLQATLVDARAYVARIQDEADDLAAAATTTTMSRATTSTSTPGRVGTPSGPP